MDRILVYYKIFKLSVIEPRQNSNNILSIRFVDGVYTINNATGIENNHFLITLSDEFENCIINVKYKNNFDRLTKERAYKFKLSLSTCKSIISKIKSVIGID